MDSTGFEMTWYNSSFEIAHYHKLSWHRVVLVRFTKYFWRVWKLFILCRSQTFDSYAIFGLKQHRWWMIISQAGRFSADCNWSEIVTWTYDCFLKEGGRRALILHCTSNWAHKIRVLLLLLPPNSFQARHIHHHMHCTCVQVTAVLKVKFHVNSVKRNRYLLNNLGFPFTNFSGGVAVKKITLYVRAKKLLCTRKENAE